MIPNSKWCLSCIHNLLDPKSLCIPAVLPSLRHAGSHRPNSLVDFVDYTFITGFKACSSQAAKKTPLTGWFKQQIFISHTSGVWEV